MVEKTTEVSDRTQIRKYSLNELYDIGIKWKKIKEDVYLTLLQMKLLAKTADVAKLKTHVAQLTIITKEDELRQNYVMDEHLMRVVDLYERGAFSGNEHKAWFPPAAKWVHAELVSSDEQPESSASMRELTRLAEFNRIREDALIKAKNARARCMELKEVSMRYAQRKMKQQTTVQAPPQPQSPQPIPPPHFVNGQPPANHFNQRAPPYAFQGPPFAGMRPMPYPPYYNYPQPQMMMQNYATMQQPQPQMMAQPYFQQVSAQPPIPMPPPTVAKARSESEGSTCSTHSFTEDPQMKRLTTKGGTPLNDGKILLLSLLSLNPQQRDEFIMKEARARGLIKKKRLANNLPAVTRKYKEVYPKIHKKALERIADTKRPEKKPKDVALETEITELIISAKKNPQHTFEELVTMLVNDVDNLDDLDKIKYALPLEKGKGKKVLDKERDELVQELVQRLVEDGKGHLHVSDIRIHARTYQKAFVSDVEAADVYISNPVLRRNALHGDIVEVYIHHAAEVDPSEIDPVDPDVEEVRPQKLGFVTRIVEPRNSRTCVGCFEPYRKETAKMGSIKFIPRDPRMPTIKILKQNWPNALLAKQPIDVENVLYLAEILVWRKNTPLGNIVKSFGACGELIAETEALLGDLNVIPYPEEIVEKYAKMDFTVPDAEFAYREDLRKLCIFTIDPATARDLDDAMSVRKMANGNFEIGVHISDVTYFFAENSFLDEIVKEKATTIYMVDNVYHMLPKPLCFMCSLLPGEDKLAFSVLWEFTADGLVLNRRFTRSVIHSCAQLAYEDAQAIIDDKDVADDFPAILGGHTFDEIRDAVKTLHCIAQHLRKKRFTNGAIRIDRPKLWFELDPKTRKPVKYAACEQTESNRLIEEFMLLANCSVAEFIHSKFPATSILRCHAPPNPNSLNSLEVTLKRFGYALSGRDSASLRDSMHRLIAGSASPEATRAVLNVLLSKPMQRAQYFCSATAETDRDMYHFGLATPIYTHFTSPIRRYADVMVHRSLSAALGYAAESPRNAEELKQLANKCNEQKWNAKVAGQQCVQLYFRHYVKELGSMKMKAGVIAVGEHSIEVVLIETDDCIKIWYKQLNPTISIVPTFSGDDPKVTSILMVFPGKEPFKVTLFTELTVEVSVYKDKMVINNVLPPV